MYTQCPDCDTAFPVTARVLQQAAGRVRCGRCGHPFNALERLSEDPPESRDGRDDPNALLDALEALAGPEDIRIEDTGVEWRVIDEDEVEAADPGDDETADESDRSAVRWYIEDADPATAGNDAGIPGTVEEAPPGADEGAAVAGRKAQQPLQLPGTDDEEELRYDDNTPLPDDFGADVEPEPPRRRAEDFAEPRSPEFDERQVDLALGEPGEWMALLDELGTGEEEPAPSAEQRLTIDDAEDDAQACELADTDIRPAGGEDEDLEVEVGDEEFPHDIDTQFDLQALEMGIELTGSRALADEDDEDDEASLSLEDDESELATDGVAGARDAGDAIELRLADDEPGELELATDTDSGTGSDAAEPAPAERAPRDDEAEADVAVQEYRPARDSSQAGLAGAKQELAEHESAPLTDEELTINRLIDQDLMRFAQEQEALATTTGGTRIPQERPHVETIIMEGEFVRTALDDDEADGSAAGPEQRESDRDSLDTWLGTPPPARAEEPRAEPRSHGAIAGIFVLGLLLLVQVVHAYRDSLATNGTFERAAAPVYRLLGTPLVPDWDARGWQFQATSGGTDAAGEVLSISSHIVNESARALPYPLIYLSLTDRWEEPLGASVLDPTEYLAPDTDTTALVPSGEGFTATITVHALSPEASGFKLNVCYPADADRVRCAIPDFRK